MENVENLKNIKDDDKINWSIISLSLAFKIKNLEQQMMICNCCEEYTYKLMNYQNELEIYKKEYRKVLIEQQKANK